MAAFGHEEKEARRVIIIGGGNIGLNLAHAVEKNHPHVNLKLIEVDKRRAEVVAQALQRAVVLHGNTLDTEILEEADRQDVVEGKSVSVRVGLGGRRILKRKKHIE